MLIKTKRFASFYYQNNRQLILMQHSKCIEINWRLFLIDSRRSCIISFKKNLKKQMVEVIE